MSIEERKNIPTESLATERYLATFGYLASISASRSNKNFKAKRIRDDLMFSSVESDVEASRKTESIVKQQQSMGGNLDIESEKTVEGKDIKKP